MDEIKSQEIKKRVDEVWKEAVKLDNDIEASEKDSPVSRDTPKPTFNIFISGMMVEVLIALGEIESPLTKTKEANLQQAKFIIDTLEMLREKTRGNLSQAESEALEAVLYELRMRYVSKSNLK